MSTATAACNVRTADLDNALVGQKNVLLELISGALDSDNLLHAHKILMFAAGIWEAVGYGYKVTELVGRIRERAEFIAQAEKNFFYTLPKRHRTARNLSQKETKKLEDLLASL